MDAQLLQFAGSLAAIAVVIALTHLLGFSRAGRIGSDAEARALFALSPGGFAPALLSLDEDGRGAIARDSNGRLAVVVPHGGQFIARVLGPGARLSESDGKLLIESRELGGKPVSLRLGDEAHEWAEQS